MAVRTPLLCLILLACALWGAPLDGRAEEGNVGEPMTDFTLLDLEGNEVTLSDDAGKVIAMTFWGWGCIECREEEMPALQSQVQEVYSPEQVRVISVNIDPQPDVERIRAYKEDKGLTYPILVNGLEVAFDYRVFATPILFLIDGQGVVRHREANKVFDADTRAALQGLIDELPVGKDVGKRALGFELSNLDGEAVRLADFAGTPVVLAFFGSRDGNCGDVLNPLQSQVVDVYGEAVIVLGVAMDLEPDPEALKALRDELGVRFPFLMDGLKTAVRYGFTAAGAVVIDAEGVIRHRQGVPLTMEIFEVIEGLAG